MAWRNRRHSFSNINISLSPIFRWVNELLGKFMRFLPGVKVILCWIYSKHIHTHEIARTIPRANYAWKQWVEKKLNKLLELLPPLDTLCNYYQQFDRRKIKPLLMVIVIFTLIFYPCRHTITHTKMQMQNVCGIQATFTLLQCIFNMKRWIENIFKSRKKVSLSIASSFDVTILAKRCISHIWTDSVDKRNE